MKVVYIAPRFHTNQAALVEGWLNHGDQVYFLVCRKGKSEDYSAIEPEVIGYSGLSHFLAKIYRKLKPNDANAIDFNLRYGLPPFRIIKKRLKEIAPDLVILREKSVYSMRCAGICRGLGILAITYNQSPLYESAEELQSRNDFSHRYVDSHMPAMRYTPVRYKNGLVQDNCTEIEKGTFFIPFVAKQVVSPAEHSVLKNPEIQILEVGKFERRKNHLLMLDAFQKVHTEIPSSKLLIVGEVSNLFHQQYLEEVQNRIKDLSLQDCVDMRLNQSRDEMDSIYRTSDLFVLPSTGEPAAYSHLEAMGYSIPVVVTSGNGTSDYYVQPGVNGEIFEDRNADDLANKILTVISNREHGRKMGEEAYRMIGTNCNFEQYYDRLIEMMRTDFI